MHLATENLTKIYGNVTALDNVSLKIPFGSVCCIAGPNGSGKTTLLETITRNIKLTRGKVILPENIKIGHSYQVPNLCEDLKVKDNIKFFIDIRNAIGKEYGEWIDKLVSVTSMNEYDEYYVSDLSTGLKKRLDIVVSLLDNPDVIAMDEPTAGLDVNARTEILDLIQFLNQNKKTVLIATHDLSGFDRICTYLIILNKGVKLLELPISDIDKEQSGILKGGISKIYEKYINP